MTTGTLNTPGDRLHALDAVRAIALLAGIALHAGLSYAPGVSSALWPLMDASQGHAVGVGIFLVHCFRMPVFFLLAGFFAHMMFHRQGTRQFLRSRAIRILLPMVLGWIASIVCIVGVMAWFLARKNGGQMPQAVPPELARSGLNFLHLWFLYVLCWLYAGVLLVRRAVIAVDRHQAWARRVDRVLGNVWVSPFKSLLLALPISAALWLQPAWVWWFGVPTPAYTLIPPPVPLFIYGYIFGLGWMLGRQRHLWAPLGGRGLVLRWLIGAGAAWVCLKMAGPEVSIAAMGGDLQVKLVYAVFYGIAMVSLMLGFIGLGIRFLARESPVVRYLSDASYWMYIAHLPLVMALQVWLMPFELHWLVKFMAVVVSSCAVLLMTYHYAVRSTWIGRLLNGRKYSRAGACMPGPGGPRQVQEPQ